MGVGDLGREEILLELTTNKERQNFQSFLGTKLHPVFWVELLPARRDYNKSQRSLVGSLL